MKNIGNFRRRGVSLVEVMIAMVILVMVGAAVIKFLNLNSKETVSIIRQVRANQYLDQIATHLRIGRLNKGELHLTQFPQIVTDRDFSADVLIGELSPAKTREVRIQIEWVSNGKKQVLKSVQTLLAP